jgi:predicted nuclease of predicted toxin-antitoxin system
MASAPVARALAALGYRVAHIGGDGQPPKGTPDDEVLAHASERNQVIVTNNNDLIVLAAERQVSLIWLDPLGVPLTKLMLLWLCADQLVWWDALLRDARGPVCIVSRKSGARVIPLDVAARRATQRIKRHERTRRRRAQYRAAQDVSLPGLDAPVDPR